MHSFQVEQELQEYDIKPGQMSSFPRCNWWCWRLPIPIGGEDVKDVFNDAGVLVFTDALVYEHRERKCMTSKFRTILTVATIYPKRSIYKPDLYIDAK